MSKETAKHDKDDERVPEQVKQLDTDGEATFEVAVTPRTTTEREQQV